MVVPLFCDVENKQVKVPEWLDPPYGPEQKKVSFICICMNTCWVPHLRISPACFRMHYSMLLSRPTVLWLYAILNERLELCTVWFLNIHQSGVLTVLFACFMAGATQNCCRLSAHYVCTRQPCTSFCWTFSSVYIQLDCRVQRCLVFLRCWHQ